MSSLEERVNILEKKVAELEKKTEKIKDHEDKIKDYDSKFELNDRQVEKMKHWFRKLDILTRNYVITNIQGRKHIKIRPVIEISDPEEINVVEREVIGEDVT
ncbi:MAG: hypothetical protein QXH16_07570 [Candidatus Bathyarchaeia archaeon]